MPLPLNTNLSLLGHSRPGDALHSKPKQAILVRMSSETLDALESISQPQVHFEFGQNPGLYIGQTRFPMRYSQENENTIHELFLRASSATKKAAPLKLHANILGKFTVERELADELRDKIRESTQEATIQRNNRTTVFIENPSDLPTNNRKKEKSNMFRKPLRPSDKPKLPSATMISTSSTAKNYSSQGHRELPESVRLRLIHFLALGEKTEEQVLFGNDTNPLPHQQIREFLDRFAEIAPTKAGSADRSAKFYRLTLSSWKEVRPYEWAGLTESQRKEMAHLAKTVFQNHGIPESDPIWMNVRHKSQPSNNFHKSSSSDSHYERNSIASSDDRRKAEAKRAVASREGRDRMKLSNDGNGKRDVPIRDESGKNYNKSLAQEGMSSSSKRTTDHEKGAERLHTSNQAKFTKIVSLQDQDRSQSPKTTTRIPRQTDVSTTSSLNASVHGNEMLSSHRPKKIRQEDRDGDEQVREKQRIPLGKRKVGDMIDREHGLRLKRKAPERVNEDSHPSSLSNPEKKRKIDQPLQTVATKKDDGISEVNTNKKSNLAQTQKLIQKTSSISSSTSSNVVKNNLLSRPTSPVQTVSSSRQPSVHALPIPSLKNAPTKHRRRSPIYTSSDEDESNRPISTTDKSKNLSGNSRLHASDIDVPKSRSGNHSALRARYNSSYLEYLTTFQKLFVQRAKIDHLLKRDDLAKNGTAIDSDGDLDLMDPEELAQLANDHKSLQTELESIQKAFIKESEGERSLSDLITI